MARNSPNARNDLPDLSPEDAFALLGNETRLAILKTLWQASNRPLSFSELRKRVGLHNSSHFNYHLQQLDGRFVSNTDDGYDLLYAGKKALAAILTGSFNERPRLEPFQIEGTCFDCGGSLEASYVDEHFTIACNNCQRRYSHHSFPPGGLVGRSKTELMRAYNQRVRHLYCLALDGVCPECGGKTHTKLTRDDENLLGGDIRRDTTCERCRETYRSFIGFGLLYDTEVFGFYRDHGRDLHEELYWSREWCVTDRLTIVHSEEPWHIQIIIPLEDEELCVTMDWEQSHSEAIQPSYELLTD